MHQRFIVSRSSLRRRAARSDPGGIRLASRSSASFTSIVSSRGWIHVHAHPEGLCFREIAQSSGVMRCGRKIGTRVQCEEFNVLYRAQPAEQLVELVVAKMTRAPLKSTSRTFGGLVRDTENASSKSYVIPVRPHRSPRDCGCNTTVTRAADPSPKQTRSGYRCTSPEPALRSSPHGSAMSYGMSTFSSIRGITCRRSDHRDYREGSD